jgi:F0F1-type ATP synthase delta subunit
MRYSTNTYAKAFVEALVAAKGAESEEVMAKNFLALVRRGGDEARLPKILDEADRMMRIRSKTRRLVVESARGLDANAKSLVAAIARSGDAIVEKIDPALIAGIKITANDEMQFDASLRRKLDNVFGVLQ